MSCPLVQGWQMLFSTFHALPVRGIIIHCLKPNELAFDETAAIRKDLVFIKMNIHLYLERSSENFFIFLIDIGAGCCIFIVNMNYKPLEKEFVKGGFRFRVLDREGDIAIVHKVAISGSVGSKHAFIRAKEHDAGFETVVVQKYDERTYPNGKVEEPKEALPSPELWGSQGWTYHTLLDAEIKFKRLLGQLPEEIKAEVSKEDEEPSNIPEVHRTRRPKGEVVEYKLPDGDFTTKELAVFNQLDPEKQYATIFIWIRDVALPEKKVVVTGERKIEGQRGKPSKTYKKVA